MGGVVGLAVVPDQLEVVEGLLHVAVLVVAEEVGDGAEVHGLADEGGVVVEAEGWVRGRYWPSRRGRGSRRTRDGPAGSARWS